ncbi:MAG: LPS export ABC transporter periplasmic protein LptC, partial [Mucinivorans sp.]
MNKLYLHIFLLFMMVGCGAKTIKATVEDPETTPTQIAHELVSVESKNGSKTYRMTTPLMERFELAKEPFSEFKQGILVETFDDTTHAVLSDLVADYARFDEKKEIWQARGNVVGRNIEDDKTLYTQELFWDQKGDRIYTDKFVRVIDGNSEYRGVGFESDGGFKRWTFRNTRGTMEVAPSDSVATDSVTQQPVQEGSVAPGGSSLTLNRVK